MEVRQVRREHVEQAVADLQERGLLTDAGPGEDGRRSAEQWLNAVCEDAAIVRTQLESTLREGRDKTLAIAVALKEARRMQHDIYRFAHEVHGISRHEIDQRGPL